MREYRDQYILIHIIWYTIYYIICICVYLIFYIFFDRSWVKENTTV